MWDIKWTEDFDLDFDYDRENRMGLTLCDDEDAFAQNITNRLRSVSPDWFYDYKGADLELLLGEANTRDTAKIGIEQIRRVLNYDGLVPDDELYIKPVPVNSETIIFFCFVKNPYDGGRFTFQTEICLSGATNVALVNDYRG